MIGPDDVADAVLFDVELDSLDGALRDVVGHDFVDQLFGRLVDADDFFGVTDRTEARGGKSLKNFEAGDGLGRI